MHSNGAASQHEQPGVITAAPKSYLISNQKQFPLGELSDNVSRKETPARPAIRPRWRSVGVLAPMGGAGHVRRLGFELDHGIAVSIRMFEKVCVFADYLVPVAPVFIFDPS